MLHPVIAFAMSLFDRTHCGFDHNWAREKSNYECIFVNESARLWVRKRRPILKNEALELYVCEAYKEHNVLRFNNQATDEFWQHLNLLEYAHKVPIMEETNGAATNIFTLTFSEKEVVCAGNYLLLINHSNESIYLGIPNKDPKWIGFYEVYYTDALIDVQYYQSHNQNPYDYDKGNRLYWKIPEPKEACPVLEKKLAIPMVVNVRVKFLRRKYPGGSKEYKTLQKWMEDPDNEYVGRGHIIDNYTFPKENSIWANPFKSPRDGTLDQVIQKYTAYIEKKVETGEISEAQLNQLSQRKRLGCWCVKCPQVWMPTANKKMVCHAQILQKIIAERK